MSEMTLRQVREAREKAESVIAETLLALWLDTGLRPLNAEVRAAYQYQTVSGNDPPSETVTVSVRLSSP